MYIDVALVKHENSAKLYLFEAPAWSHLEANDKVTVETAHGTEDAKIVSVYTVDTNDEIFDFIAMATGATLPLARIVGKWKFQKFEY